MKEIVDSHFNSYFNNYDQESDEEITESKSNNSELCRPLISTEFYDFFETHLVDKFEQEEVDKICEILSQTYADFDSNKIRWDQNTRMIAYFDDKEIDIIKFQDSWFLVKEQWINSWNKDPHYYLCDELDSIKYIDFYA